MLMSTDSSEFRRGSWSAISFLGVGGEKKEEKEIKRRKKGRKMKKKKKSNLVGLVHFQPGILQRLTNTGGERRKSLERGGNWLRGDLVELMCDEIVTRAQNVLLQLPSPDTFPFFPLLLFSSCCCP